MDEVTIYAYGSTIDCKELPENATVYTRPERPQDRDADSVYKWEVVGDHT